MKRYVLFYYIIDSGDAVLYQYQLVIVHSGSFASLN